MKIRLTLATVLVASALPVIAADLPSIKVCSEDGDSSPWLFKDRPGLTNSLLKMAEKKLGSKIDMVGLPWKRCTEEVKAGTYDGAVKISFSPERAVELGVYPMIGDKQDPSKRLLIDSYSLYRAKGSSVTWDGKALKTDGTVGAQSGFSIVAALKALNVKVDDGTKTADDNLKKLVNGRIVAVALQTEEGDTSLNDHPEYKEKIEKMVPVLVEKPYYLMFSKQFYAKNPDHAKAVWNAIEAARESKEYKDLVKNFK